MDIAIIGAGIAGCTAYLQLKKHLPNISSIKIYETHGTNEDNTAEERRHDPTYSATLRVGGGIAVAPNGLGVLSRLDGAILSEAVQSGYVASHSNLKDKNGDLLMRIEPNGPKGNDAPSRMNSLACSRHALWNCLRKRIPTNDIINRKVLEVNTTADGPNMIRFVDGGDSIEADLIIGADGVHSISKKALFPGQEDPYPPEYQGLTGIGGFVPAADLLDQVEKGSMNFIFGGNGFFGYFFADSDMNAPHRDSVLHVSDPGEHIAWWSTYETKECPNRKSLDLAEVARQLQDRHSQWKDPVVRKILESVQIQDMYPTWASAPLPTWHREGLVLLGDAAHALPPTSGQGASQALEDCEAFALFLAHYVQNIDVHQGPGDHDRRLSVKQAINEAAEKYMTLRQPRVDSILTAAKKHQNSKRNMGFVQEYLMYASMRILGLFPQFVNKPIIQIIDYNVAEEVAKVVSSDH